MTHEQILCSKNYYNYCLPVHAPSFIPNDLVPVVTSYVYNKQ